ncbi:MAG: RNA-binding S4 domain-containing protein [Gammaproteobacteria bacterium]|uniref:RNA-binding S4 domain-containing protein n=1 Tax=Rhodoferax sp. TaxID=50421 RepID=UPI0018204E19|nr:S4 domain-containing protein [Rhodoferax sp.]MBU3897589.1 RNA-binding S4 domain-containing protein [Gammaproteobacteria bacterium]MBA3059408.1 RNA-binding S4 domain-containing protein [Rhodoferax sp.]MBU3997474.1 RNA-binding S4 domain-containing protein [Gammaproteobacteria bacterium]MBU4017767.1 RNA-binding S4 domain-containing protein [Gammaproteobacteria bacterium]MBU4081210.1 RNA-binding S4 domain-containing protein [Gammaproteobacteria bacterium]
MERLRIDKWLWAARFYKTRSLASEDIDKGRVHINGVAVKPAREVKVGDTLQLRASAITRTVVVQAISDKRGPAPVAALLFQETAESIASRALAAEQRRLAPEPALSLTQGRPTKRDRRDTEKARNGQVHDWDQRWSASIDT